MEEKREVNPLWVTKCELPKKVMPRANRESKVGDTRTEEDDNIQSEGYRSYFHDEQEREYCKFLEKGIANNYIGGDKIRLSVHDVRTMMREQYGIECDPRCKDNPKPPTGETTL